MVNQLVLNTATIGLGGLVLSVLNWWLFTYRYKWLIFLNPATSVIIFVIIVLNAFNIDHDSYTRCR